MRADVDAGTRTELITSRARIVVAAEEARRQPSTSHFSVADIAKEGICQ